MTLTGYIVYKPFVDIRRRFLLGRRQTWVWSLKSTNLPYLVAVSSQVAEMTSELITYYDDIPFWIPVNTNKDDLEWSWMPHLWMSHGLLADSVDTSLASLLYTCSCKTDAVLSEVHDQWVSREILMKLTRCLSAVAKLLVFKLSVSVQWSPVCEWRKLSSAEWTRSCTDCHFSNRW